MTFFDFVRVLTYLPLRIVFPTKIIDKEKYNYEKAVVCCNHYCSMDVIVIASRLFKKTCCCIGKEEVFKHKLVANLFVKCGAISIKRGESDMAAYKKIISVLREGKQLLIFPEGTRNKEGTPQMRYFEQGAASFAIKADAPIIPVLYHKPLKPFRRDYMIVGDPIDLSSFAELSSHEAREKATEYLYNQMSALKQKLDDYVLAKKKGKQ